MKIGLAAVAPLVCVNALSADQVIAQTRIRILFISPPQVGRRNDKPNLLVKCSPRPFPQPQLDVIPNRRQPERNPTSLPQCWCSLEGMPTTLDAASIS